MKLMYINGEFTRGHAKEEIEVTNPATEEVLDRVPRGTAEDVEFAVRSGNEAFKPWRKLGANERTSRLHEVATRIRRHKGELVQLLTLEEGKPISENDEELEWVANTFDYYAELGRHDRGRERRRLRDQPLAHLPAPTPAPLAFKDSIWRASGGLTSCGSPAAAAHDFGSPTAHTAADGCSRG